MNIFSNKIMVIVGMTLLIGLNSWACKPIKQTAEQKQRMHLTWRADRNALIKEDFDLIDKYLTQEITSSRNSTDTELMRRISIFSRIITQSALSNDYLQQFKNWANLVKTTNNLKSNRYLDDIIWWSEARQLTNKADLIALKQNSKKADRMEEIISLFVENGMVDELQDWQAEVSFNKSDLLFEFAIRKAKIVNLLNTLPFGFGQQLLDEFIVSLNDIFPILQSGHIAGHNHLHWLFKHMGQYNELPEVRQLLMTLKEDPLYFHQEQVLLTIEKVENSKDFTTVEHLRSTIIERINIIPWAMEALQPEDPYSSREYYGCY